MAGHGDVQALVAKLSHGRCRCPLLVRQGPVLSSTGNG
jgi:hypothetical protein